mgnify:CR=1 FL=1
MPRECNPTWSMRLRQYSSGKSAADGEKSVCQYPVPRHAVARTHLMRQSISMHSVSSASLCGRPHAPDDEGNQHALRGHQHALVMHHEPQQADRVRVDHFAMADDTAARGEGTREHGPKRHVVEERATAAHLMREAISSNQWQSVAISRRTSHCRAPDEG